MLNCASKICFSASYFTGDCRFENVLNGPQNTNHCQKCK